VPIEALAIEGHQELRTVGLDGIGDVGVYR
jgi:hypothetical protein